MRVSENYIAAAKKRALSEIERRREIYLNERQPISPNDKTVIIVDDGLATGATMEAAIKAARQADPSKLVVAIPVAPADTVDRLRLLVDEMVCLETPSHFYSVGSYYLSFPQLNDDEVVDYLNKFDNNNAQYQNRNA